MKNFTARGFAFYMSALIFLCVFGVTVLLNSYFKVNWLLLLVFNLLSAVFSFFITYYFINVFVYRRIKLIYKKISSVKDSEQDDKLFAPNAIALVENDVEQWIEKQTSEIASLRALANYRRNFLGNISHELKTPLFNIQGYIDTLIDGGYQEEKINLDYLKRAAVNVDRLITIIDDLEAIQHYEASDLILDIQRFEIKDLLLEVMADAERKAKERSIKITFKEDANTPFWVKADREAMRQVFNNLIINSIKYGNKDGKTRIGLYDMDMRVLIEISDNGIGIEEKHLPHVFDRFYRVDKSRSRDQGGSGLGLSIVKHIIEAHKQAINVRSQPGVGTTFALTLPKG